MKRVITYGTFDLFNKGHYNLLKRSKELGDYLIVGVTTEEYDAVRGKLNVADSLMTRIENVRKTGFADEIIIESSAGQKFRDIKKYNIDVLTVGSDWNGKFDFLKDYCEVVYLERTKNISSTIMRENNQHILQIGIIGSGRIAERFIPEVKLVSGVDCVGVYNPNTKSAQRFAKKYEIDYYEDLNAFFCAVDALYIASPHETHYEYIKKSLEKGKHVLCEKPMVLSKAQAEKVFEIAHEKKLILMEGIKTAYCAGFNNMIALACSGVIGSIKNIEACFTKLERKDSRELTNLKYGGSFTELGSYVLLPIIKIFGDDYDEIRFDVIKDDNGLDIFTKAHFRYKNGFATATCGLGVKSEGQLIISGTEGYIIAETPWWKTTYFEVRRENVNETEKYIERFSGDGLRYEISDFISMINGKTTSDFKLTYKESISIIQIIEKFLNENR